MLLRPSSPLSRSVCRFHLQRERNSKRRAFLYFSRWTSSLLSYLWSKDLSISLRFTPYDSLSRCMFSTLTTRQPMVEFHLLTFPRFPLRKKQHKYYFGKNRTHHFRTSRCAGYLLDHSGDEGLLHKIQGSLSRVGGGVLVGRQLLDCTWHSTCIMGGCNTFVRNPLKACVCVGVCVFIKLHITTQSGPVILVILRHSHWSSQGGINDTWYENL